MQVHRTPIAHDLRVEFITDPSHALAAPRQGPDIPGPIVQTVFTGTAGSDTLIGGTADDVFDIFQGGNDQARGKAGDDQFNLGAAFTAADRIEGGPDDGGPSYEGRDRVILDGDYSAGVAFTATTMTGVEAILLNPGHSYSLITHDATLAPGAFMTIRADSLLAGDSFTFNGAAEGDASSGYLIDGGPGLDRLIGGAGSDQFYFQAGCLTASDRLDGGAGSNSITLNGDYNLTLDNATIKNLYTLYFVSGFDYTLTFVDANIDAGRTMTVHGDFLASGVLNFDGSLERDGNFILYGGAENDTLTGGRRDDILQGREGADTLTGGNGADLYQYFAAGNSTSTHYDTVVGFDFLSADRFHLIGSSVSAIDKLINSGRLSTANFDTQLAAAANATHLGAGHAVVFTPDMGGLAGLRFLIVDVNGVAGYQANEDYVMLLSGTVHPGAIDIADFA